MSFSIFLLICHCLYYDNSSILVLLNIIIIIYFYNFLQIVQAGSQHKGFLTICNFNALESALKIL